MVDEVVLDDSMLDDKPIFSPVCDNCKRMGERVPGFVRKCQAFNWIPDAIWTGKNKHRKPFVGDNGLRFIPKGAE